MNNMKPPKPPLDRVDEGIRFPKWFPYVIPSILILSMICIVLSKIGII